MIEPAQPHDRSGPQPPHQALISDGGRAALHTLKTELHALETSGLEVERIPGRPGELDVLEATYRTERRRVRAVNGEYWGETAGSERGWVIGRHDAAPHAAQTIRDMLVSAAGEAGAES